MSLFRFNCRFKRPLRCSASLGDVQLLATIDFLCGLVIGIARGDYRIVAEWSLSRIGLRV